MSSFTSRLELFDYSKNQFFTGRELVYYIGDKTDDKKITVPKGFVTDGASIPKWFWPIVGHPMGEYRQAAVVHDFLYGNHIMTKEESDKQFLDAMTVLSISKWKREVMYYSVLFFGHKSYQNGPKKFKVLTEKEYEEYTAIA